MTERMTVADFRALTPKSEKDVVQEIRTTLERLGYLVSNVGQLRAKGSGTTTGYPDLSIRHELWPKGMACLIEVKTSTGRLSEAQETMHGQGWSYVVRSAEEAIEALRAFGRERCQP